MGSTLYLTGVICTLVVVLRSITSTSIDCAINLSLSPLAKNLAESLLEIHWGPKCFQPPAWIGLYHQNPTLHDIHPDYYVETEDLPSGSHLTNVQFGNLKMPANWDRNNAIQFTAKPTDRSPICLNFYIAAFNASNVIQTVDCLKLQPQWMGNMESMWMAPLRSIFIPGSHCSGCFPNRFSGRTMLLNKFGYTQNIDVWTQLVMGIRHLDLRIGFKSHKGPHLDTLEYWAVHENLFVTPLSEILRDIQQFARLTGEFVLVDFREFPIGFYNHPERHVGLVELIKSHLGHLIFERNSTMDAAASGDISMAEMRDCGRMVLVTYNEAIVVINNSMLWTPWKQFTTKSLQTTEYLGYLRKAFTRKDLKNFSWILTAAQSVESSYTSNGNHLPTSRERAAAVNNNITSWLSGPWSQLANVVSMDYVWSTNLIDLAIQTNSHKQWSNVYDVFIMQ